MATAFRPVAGSREVMDRVFTMTSDDPETYPRLHDADAPYPHLDAR